MSQAPDGASPRHYLDWASTSPLRPDAASAIRDWIAQGAAGDPGRIHRDGQVVRVAVEQAREQIADLFAVRPRQVIFTSSGTESVNAAVFAASQAWARGAGAHGGSGSGPLFLAAAVEHSSVREASARAGSLLDLPVDSSARLDLAALGEIIDRAGPGDVALLHCQWANHEVGTLQPVAELVSLSHDLGVPVHVDAAAAAGHLPLDLSRDDGLGATYVSVSAHKFGGPPGVGALIVRPGLSVAPLLVGGQQERARRGGIENVLGIVGFGAAAASVASVLNHEASMARDLIAQVVSGALLVDGVRVIGPSDPAARLPHLVCLGVDGVEAEPILLGLDRAGISVHSGSACASETFEPSPVLEAIGELAGGSLRVSVGPASSARDVEAFAASFGPTVEALRSLR